MSNLVPFVYDQEGKPAPVRLVLKDGNPWFIAADVAKVLGYRDAESATRHLDEDEKDTITASTLGGAQGLTVISESGLYALILRSRKPAAKAFRKWVTAEVLPSIRRTGSYTVGQIDQERIRAHLHQHQLRVLAAIEGASQDGICRLRTSALAELAGLSVENVRRCIDLLFALGVVHPLVEPQGGGS